LDRSIEWIWLEAWVEEGREGVIRSRILVKEGHLFTEEEKRRGEKFEARIKKREDLFVVHVKSMLSLMSQQPCLQQNLCHTD